MLASTQESGIVLRDTGMSSQAHGGPNSLHTNTRPQRNVGAPAKYSPSSSAPKPYVLNRAKALSRKEDALDRPYTPEVASFSNGTLVVTFQAMVYEAFKQNVQKLEEKEGYSIVMPKESNRLTADGQADANSLQININGRKAYTINFYHTTSKITVTGQKTKSVFVEGDMQYILDSISGAGISNRHIYLLTNAAREAIGRAKKLPGPTLLEIEGSTAAKQPSSTGKSGTDATSLQVGTNPLTAIDTQPLLATNHIPTPHHSTPPVVCPVSEAPPVITLGAPATVTTTTVSSPTCTTAWTSMISRILALYDLPSAHSLMETPPSPSLWKTKVTKAIHSHWERTILALVATYPSLRFISTQ